jgi:hypothetical protein
MQGETLTFVPPLPGSEVLTQKRGIVLSRACSRPAFWAKPTQKFCDQRRKRKTVPWLSVRGIRSLQREKSDIENSRPETGANGFAMHPRLSNAEYVGDPNAPAVKREAEEDWGR